MLGTIKDGISLRLFGNKDDEDVPEEDKKEGAIGKVKKGLTSAASSFYNGLTGWKNALFGKSSDNEDEDPEKTGKKIFEDIKKNYGYYNYYTDPLMNYTNFFAILNPKP